MADDLMTAGKWADKLGVPVKQLKDGLKAAKVKPDATKGGCAYYSKASCAKALKAAK